MNVIRKTCGSCAGIGRVAKYEIISDGCACTRPSVCKNCNGKGWTEYAVFSVEEAKAILKHCGLDTGD